MYLSLKKLSKKFENKEAVKNINLDINKGELVSLLGPSGCGKTTTLKMIGGFLNPTEGKIYLEDTDITHFPPELRPISTVFQNYALFPHMTVIENVIYGLKFQKNYSKSSAITKGKNILNIVGLEDYIDMKVTKLSGGQQQRVALARSLILNPKVLLLDEPLSNLDAKLRLKMRKEIKDIQRKFDITMIFVTHDQEEALSISDRVVIMNNGNIQQIGSPQHIYNSPSNSFVADFVGKINIININGESKLIRPEHLKLSDENGQFKGTVMGKQFLGIITTYFVSIMSINNSTIQVDVMNNGKQDHWHIGEEVYVSMD